MSVNFISKVVRNNEVREKFFCDKYIYDRLICQKKEFLKFHYRSSIDILNLEDFQKNCSQRTGIADGWVFIERPAWQLQLNLDLILKVCSYA